MTTLDKLPIRIDAARVEEFCRMRGIRRLSLFGSVVRPDFDPDHSDVDVLADFEPGALDGIGWNYFGYADELADIIGRRVDFCSQLDKHVRPLVERELLPIYERP